VKERFDFGLERVRKVRAHAEDRAKEELAASLAHRLRGEAQLQSLSEQLHAAHGAPVHAATVDATILRHRQAYLERLERTRMVAALELDRAEAEVDARREVLMGKSREREVLDKLRDRQAATHAQAFARHEGALLDEIALQAHVRNRTHA
jgi:flagellar FliJ protein